MEFQLYRCSWAIVGKMVILDFWAIFRIDVRAVQTPSNCLGIIDLGAATPANQLRPVLHVSRKLDFYSPFGQSLFLDRPNLIGVMLRAGPKLDGAFGVVVGIHRQTANTLAVTTALISMSSDRAEMLMN